MPQPLDHSDLPELPNLPELRRLRELAARLPEPTQYYDGLRAAPALPRNVLAFHRPRGIWGASCHGRHLLILNLGSPSLLAVDGHVLDMPTPSAAVVFPYQHHHYPDQPDARPRRLFLTFDLPATTPLPGGLNQRVLPLDKRAMTLAADICAAYPAYEPAPAGGHATGGAPGQAADDGRLASLPPASTPRGDHTQEAMTPDTHGQLILTLAMLLEHLRRQATAGDAPTQAHEPAPLDDDRRLVQAVGAYLHDHQGHAVTIDELADALLISPSHLRHRFKQAMRLSLGRYIRRWRLLQAARLMDMTDRTISQIARDTGHETFSAFSRAFSREMGVGPRQYRLRQ